MEDAAGAVADLWPSDALSTHRLHRCPGTEGREMFEDRQQVLTLRLAAAQRTSEFDQCGESTMRSPGKPPNDGVPVPPRALSKFRTADGHPGDQSPAGIDQRG